MTDTAFDAEPNHPLYRRRGLKVSQDGVLWSTIVSSDLAPISIQVGSRGMNRGLCYLLVLITLVFAASSMARDDAPSKVLSVSGLRNDIEFAKVGNASLTLDAFVPESPGPFPTCILVHGGGFVRGDKQTYIKPLFE